MKRLILFLLPILFFASPAFAVTSVTQYVNTTGSCANNGDGTTSACAASGGAAGAFNSWSNWEGQNTDLVAADKDLTVNFAGTVTSASVLAGWTTNGTHKMKLKNLTMISTDYQTTFQVDQNYVTFEDLIVGKTSTGAVNLRVMQVTGTAVNFTMNRATFYHGPSVADDGGSNIVEIADASNAVRFIDNVVIYGSKENGFSLSLGSTNTVSVYNMTVVGSAATGVSISCNTGCGTSTVNLKNVVATSNSGGDFDTPLGSETFNHSNNVSSDTTSPDVGGRSKTISYVNAGANDYTPATGETDLIDAGTDLSGTGFSDDRAGVTRPVGAAWDIGAYEAPAAGGSSDAILLMEF